MLLGLSACTGVGGPVPGAPAHHREHGFANANPTFTRPALWTRTTFFARRIWASTFTPRTVDLPRVPNDGAGMREMTACGVRLVAWLSILHAAGRAAC